MEFEISQLLGVPLKTHASGTRLYISERLSSVILKDRLARLTQNGIFKDSSGLSGKEMDIYGEA